MKKCPECGTYVPDDNRFCTSCGASLADAQSVMDEVKEEVAGTSEEESQEAEESTEEAVSETAEEAEPVAAEEEENKEEEPLAASFAPVPPQTDIVPAVVPATDYSGSSSYSEQTSSTESSSIPGSKSGIEERSIVVCILLSLVTCGIYSYYWVYKLNEEINQLSGEQGTSGGMVILFDIITCGIYSWYWMYRMGERVDIMKRDPNGSSNIIYLVLGIFDLGIVSLCLMQDSINKQIKTA